MRDPQVTAEVYLRRLGWFCKRRGLSPQKLVAMEQKELENLLLDLVSELEEQGKAGSYIESIIKAVKSWLSFNHRELKVKIKIKGARDTPSLREERVPPKPSSSEYFSPGTRKPELRQPLWRSPGSVLRRSEITTETMG